MDPKRWTTSHVEPLVITSRNDWHRDITNMMNALVASRTCEFLNIRYRRQSPHFTATVPLAAIAPESQPNSGLADALRELAAGASAGRF